MRLIVIEGERPGAILPLAEGETMVGRHPDCAIRIPSEHVSGRHCVFVSGPDGLRVRDLGSTNGVQVEGQRVGEALLAHDARVRIGDWVLGVDLEGALPPPVAGTGFGLARVSSSDSGDITTESRPAPRSGAAMGRGRWGEAARRTWAVVLGLPWTVRLASIFALAGLLLLVAPGGLMSQLARVSAAAEEQAVDRGRALAIALAARNASAFEEHDDLVLDVSLVKGEPGVRRALVVDAHGTVRAPPERARQSVTGTAAFIEASEHGDVTALRGDGGTWSILAPIRAGPVDGAPATVEGWAFLEVDVAVMAASSKVGAGRVGAAILTLALVMTGAFVLARRLAVRPLTDLQEDLEQAMRGHAAAIRVSYAWTQADELARSINRLLERWRKAGAAEDRDDG